MAQPSLPDAYNVIQSRGLGLAAKDASGIPAHVGISSLGSTKTVIPISDIDQVRTTLGYGPLANAVAEALAAGARTLFAVPAETGTAGDNGAVTDTKTGDGTVTPGGAPVDAFQVQVEILSDGVLGAATFRYSLDGGNTWSQEITVPAGGAYSIPNTGIDLTFACTEGFDDGDLYEWETTEPLMSTATAGDAVDALLGTDYRFGFVHVVGPSASALWTALGTKASTAESSHKYIWFLAEGDLPGAAETKDQWRDGLISEQDGFASDYVQVCAALWRIVDPLTGQQRRRNLAAVFAGWFAGARKISDSPAHVERGPIPLAIAGGALPDGIGYADFVALDGARYLTARHYEDLDGVYFTADPMMAAETSDFRFAHLRRVMNKAARQVRIAALPHVWGDGDLVGQKALETSCKRPLERMKGAGEIVDYFVQIPADQDVLGEQKLVIKLRIQPKPKMAWIELDLGFHNPYAT